MVFWNIHLGIYFKLKQKSISKLTEIFSSSNWIFTACVAYKNQVRTEMEFLYSQTENFEMEKLSSDTGYFKKPAEINRGFDYSVVKLWLLKNLA